MASAVVCPRHPRRELIEPDGRHRIARRTPVPARAQRPARADLRPIGQGAALELAEGEEALVPQTWDGMWRIILLDLPEERKSERESLRYLLKKAGFVCLKNSAWISPFPFEHLFTNIKKDLGLTTEMMIIVTEHIDEESKKVLFETFGK